MLAAPLRGRGLAEEAMRAAMGWARENGTGDRLTCIIHPDNFSSRRLAAKLDFREFATTFYNGAPVVLLERQR